MSEETKDQVEATEATEPEAKSRKVLGRKGRLYVGKARAPEVKPAQPAKPTGDTYF